MAVINTADCPFTPTERAMLEILSDGKLHTREELKTCCGPCSMPAIKYHLVNIRKKLKKRCEDVVCVRARYGFFYQHVRLLDSPYDGRT